MRPPSLDACTDDTHEQAIPGFADGRLDPAKLSSTALCQPTWYIHKNVRTGSKQGRMGMRLPWVRVEVWIVSGQAFCNLGSHCSGSSGPISCSVANHAAAELKG